LLQDYFVTITMLVSVLLQYCMKSQDLFIIHCRHVLLFSDEITKSSLFMVLRAKNY